MTAQTVAGAVSSLVRLATDTGFKQADVKPGWVAFVIVVLLCVVTTLLWLSMRKQLGKIRFVEQDTRRRGDDEPPAA